MKTRLFHTIIAVWQLSILPLTCWAGEEEPLAVTTPQFRPLDSMLAIGKLLAAFLIVGALMALLFKGMKKMGLGHGTPSKGGLISVLDTKMIAPKKYISVVRVAGEDLAIGITDNSFTLLSKLGPAASPSASANPAGDFAGTLSKVDSNHSEEATDA